MSMRTNKEILAVVNQMVSDGQISQDIAEKYFPEIKESKDERIRTFLRHTFTALCKDKLGKWHGEPVVNILAWLEKQGGQKPAEISNICEFSIKTWVKIVDYVLTEHNGIGNYLIDPEVKDTAEKLQKKYKFDAASEEWDRVYRKGLDAGVNKGRAEALREQKPAVIIPKFRVGDEIKTSNEGSLTITKIDEKGYWSEDLFICSFEDSAKWELVRKLVDKVEPKFKIGDVVRLKYGDGLEWLVKEKHEDGNYTIACADRDDCVLLDDKWELVKQKSADKFEIDDLITNGILVGKIDEIHELGYHAYFGDHYADVPDIENWHKWTIEDANGGDVLCTYECGEPKIVFILKGTPKKPYVLGFHCYYNIMYPHFESDSKKGCLAPNEEDIKPATKEQRDILMKAMADAGYTFDFEKKELKKIGQKPAGVKPKFKVGDTIRLKNSNAEYIIESISDSHYYGKGFSISIIGGNRDYELVGQKPTDNVESSAFKDKLLELFQKFRYIKEGVPTNGDIIDYVDAHMQELIDRIEHGNESSNQ